MGLVTSLVIVSAVASLDGPSAHQRFTPPSWRVKEYFERASDENDSILNARVETWKYALYFSGEVRSTRVRKSTILRSFLPPGQYEETFAMISGYISGAEGELPSGLNAGIYRRYYIKLLGNPWMAASFVGEGVTLSYQLREDRQLTNTELAEMEHDFRELCARYMGRRLKRASGIIIAGKQVTTAVAKLTDVQYVDLSAYAEASKGSLRKDADGFTYHANIGDKKFRFVLGLLEVEVNGKWQPLADGPMIESERIWVPKSAIQ